MNKSNVRRINKSDDGVVDVCRQHHGFYMQEFFCRIEDKVRWCYFWFDIEMKFFIRNIDPNRIADLFQRIAEDPDLAEINIAPRRYCGDIFADTVGSKLPSMVAALNGIILEPSFGEWYSAMGAIVA